MKKKLTYDGWELFVRPNSIKVKKCGEVRIYDIPNIRKVEQEGEYVFIYNDEPTFLQVKFESDNFLVIDEFDEDGELVADIGAHVFGEE